MAEYALLNNASTSASVNINNSAGSSANANISIYALDLVAWKTIQKGLHNLAVQIEDEKRAPEGQAQLYKTLSSEQWWQKNVAPSFALSKADTKDLAAIGKDLDLASTTILSLTLTVVAPTKTQSIEEVRAAAKFLRTGGAYLQLRNVLNGYESEVISAVAEIQKGITNTEIEMGYQIQLAKGLEELFKRFPSGGDLSNQVVDPKDSGAKYLPITTQIIAANNDINQSKEVLRRLRDRLDQLELLKTFVEQANPLVQKTFDGLALVDELFALESSMRTKLAKDDIKKQEVLDQLRSQLLFVQSRFTKGLEANTAPTSKKTGMIKATAGGLVAGFFLMLFVLLGQRLWINLKGAQAK